MKVDKLQEKVKSSRQSELDKKKRLLIVISITFIVAIAVLLVWIFLFKNTSRLREFENDYITFNFDASWTVSRNREDIISLTHETKSFVDIKFSKIVSEHLNDSIASFADEIKYDIEKQNSNYKLLKEEEKEISKNKYKTYKLLYESEDSQTMVTILRNEDYLFVVTYTANNKYFDILLDSFQTILGSIELK